MVGKERKGCEGPYKWTQVACLMYWRRGNQERNAKGGDLAKMTDWENVLTDTHHKTLSLFIDHYEGKK